MKSTFNLSLQKISRIAILSALCVALRYAFSSLPNIQPITAIFLITAIVYGLSDSILIMSLTMLVSSFLLMFGPWVIWQIFSFTVILVIWKYLLYPLTKFLKFAKINEIVWQSLFAGLLGIVYGLVIDSCYAFLYGMPWWTYVMAGASFNIAHALSTVCFYPLILPILRRMTNEKNH